MNDRIMNPENCAKPNEQRSCSKEACSKVCHQHTSVSVPVEISPNAVVGPIETECIGEPIICCKGKCPCELVIT